ncbi:hypothetical protein BCV69DRAFT_152593 [Microstroma glucosiphilum]|uniref:Uncharacterized protein n=1 Tax=Pseudomicrostroma glucosiphilum TaxID=1684307 RepID=A0A316UBC9_9BASI|nr:hypothetical protein BCV69DRAFT_152593 [Pseudomicrostroma glucosiphilum]PWN21703.1 hypothetical protein BCV69DRAFT_152593 [Pseudomicrostroma glucosiphilum]
MKICESLERQSERANERTNESWCEPCPQLGDWDSRRREGLKGQEGKEERRRGSSRSSRFQVDVLLAKSSKLCRLYKNALALVSFVLCSSLFFHSHPHPLLTSVSSSCSPVTPVLLSTSSSLWRRSIRPS